MTRAAAWMGWLLGITVLVAGATEEGGWARGVSVGGAVLLAWCSWAASRGNRGAQGLLCLLGFAFLAVALPRYFRTYEVWPALVVILFGTLTLGFGVTGWVLDRFGEKPPRERRL